MTSHSHHASEDVLHVRFLGVSEHSFKQQGVLGDPLVGFGLHVSKSHTLALRMSLYPLEQNKKGDALISVIESSIVVALWVWTLGFW